MQQKYVHFASKRPSGWNLMAFYGCKVLSLEATEFKAGKRISLEIEAPKLKKKYYLYGFNDEGLVDAIMSSGLKVGDVISCYAELSYYKNNNGRYCEAYKIAPNCAYNKDIPENETYFQFLRIVREDTCANAANNTNNGHLTKEQLISKLL